MLWIPVAFISGAIVGGFAGGFIGTNGAKKRIEELEERLKMLEKEKTDLVDKYDHEADKALAEATASLQKAFTAEPPVSSLDESEEEKENEEEVPKRGPFLITESEFRNEFATIDDDHLTYYSRDGVLADDGGNEVDNPRSLLGQAYDQLVNGEFEDEDTIYIHNEQLEQNFEIEIDFSSSYYRDISAADVF